MCFQCLLDIAAKHFCLFAKQILQISNHHKSAVQDKTRNDKTEQ